MTSRLFAALLLLLCTGCTSMHRYGTARTMPAGELAFSATADLVQGYEPQSGTRFAAAMPVAPRLGVRYGLARGTEVGFEAGAVNGTLELKQELLRSRWLDLALAPAATAGWGGIDGEDVLVLAQLPLLVGIHATDWLTFVPQLSAGWGWREAELGWDAERTWLGSPLAGGGLGLFFRLADGVALQPLGTMTWELDSGYRYTSGGVSIFYGALPGRGGR